MTDDELLRQQHSLQIEAKEVADELQLDELLTTVGEPTRVGSSALGLMVWRDLDITVVCSSLNKENIAHIAREMMVRRGVRELRFLNDSGSLKMDSDYPDGLYLGIKYRSLNGADWKLDIWFVDEPEKQPDLQHIKTMPARITPELRKSILNIKRVWSTRVEYGKQVTSYDIYTAVLDDDIRTLSQFDEWLRNKSTK
ncbi:hypothetical protein [Alicyclobacillus fodiniaquatilis]|uniref:Polymerase nucleotidyl transferase domain-containing protein n=1 Tax=Alicyclobacillus fodiniaquatilis TaxID=1661150 RepID=A0ABW4JF28_9BACL